MAAVSEIPTSPGLEHASEAIKAIIGPSDSVCRAVLQLVGVVDPVFPDDVRCEPSRAIRAALAHAMIGASPPIKAVRLASLEGLEEATDHVVSALCSGTMEPWMWMHVATYCPSRALDIPYSWFDVTVSPPIPARAVRILLREASMVPPPRRCDFLRIVLIGPTFATLKRADRLRALRMADGDTLSEVLFQLVRRCWDDPAILPTAIDALRQIGLVEEWFEDWWHFTPFGDLSQLAPSEAEHLCNTVVGTLWSNGDVAAPALGACLAPLHAAPREVRGKVLWFLARQPRGRRAIQRHIMRVMGIPPETWSEPVDRCRREGCVGDIDALIAICRTHKDCLPDVDALAARWMSRDLPAKFRPRINRLLVLHGRRDIVDSLQRVSAL